MRDPQRGAAAFLRASLWIGAALVTGAGALDATGWGTAARTVGAVGIGVVVAAPFGTLVAIAVVGRRSGTVAYAVASLVLAVAGLLLAR